MINKKNAQYSNLPYEILIFETHALTGKAKKAVSYGNETASYYYFLKDFLNLSKL